MSSLLLRPFARQVARRAPTRPGSGKVVFRPFSAQKINKCPSCGSPLPTALPACMNCWYIGNSVLADKPFQLYDVLQVPTSPNPFLIDTTALKIAFRKAQGVCHPDSWTSKGKDKEELAQALSSRINIAYQTLLHPIARAEYLLEMNGNPVSEEDKIEDTQFLAEMFIARESVDDAGTKDDLEAIDQENSEQMTKLFEEIGKYTEKQAWDEVKANVIKLKYLQNIRQEVSQRMQE